MWRSARTSPGTTDSNHEAQAATVEQSVIAYRKSVGDFETAVRGLRFSSDISSTSPSPRVPEAEISSVILPQYMRGSIIGLEAAVRDADAQMLRFLSREAESIGILTAEAYGRLCSEKPTETRIADWSSVDTTYAVDDVFSGGDVAHPDLDHYLEALEELTRLVNRSNDTISGIKVRLSEGKPIEDDSIDKTNHLADQINSAIRGFSKPVHTKQGPR